MYAIVAVVVTVCSATTQADLQGTWQGIGRAAPYSAVFCYDILAMRVGTHPLLETRESRFRLDPDEGTIDIERSDGLQLGRYSVEGDRLTLVLADVNQPRPAALDLAIAKPTPAGTRRDGQGKIRRRDARYVFERVGPAPPQ